MKKSRVFETVNRPPVSKDINRGWRMHADIMQTPQGDAWLQARALQGAPQPPATIEDLRAQMGNLMNMMSSGKGGSPDAWAQYRPAASQKGGRMEMSRAFNGECFACGKIGHRASDCPSRVPGAGGKGSFVGVGNVEKKVFPTPPKLPAHIKPRICRFGMRCRNEKCTYIHIRTKTGRTIASLGLGNEPIEGVKDGLTYEGDNLYVLDDEGLEVVQAPSGTVGGITADESDDFDADPLGLGNLAYRA